MLPEAALSPPSAQWLASRFPARWRAALLPFTAAALVVLLAFAQDWSRIAAIAWQSSTFNHILLVPPILCWMVAQRADMLLRLEPEPWWPALAGVAGSSTLWLLGAFTGVDIASQFGAVALLVSLVPLFLGVQVSAALAFPLFYAFLLVPMGEGLVPTLQLVTAKITVALVEASGVPAHIEGVFIDTPAGLFEVAEACSGVKFLIAMIALGLLIANVCFRSWTRRILFMAACVVVPILANGVRAFATIWIAQSIGAERAVGFDHIVYGWFFFAFIVALLLAGAWPFFDRAADAPMTDAQAIADSPMLARFARARAPVLTMLACLALIVGAVHAWARAGDSLRADIPAGAVLPALDGWTQVTEPASPLAWRPRADGAHVRLQGRYRNVEGGEADVFLALYSSLGDGREPGGFGQGALPPDAGWSWRSPGPAFTGGKSEWLRGDDGTERLAVTWYVSGALVTGSNARLRLRSIVDKLWLEERPAALLIVSSADHSPGRAEATVRRFMEDAGPPLRWMDRLGVTE